MGASGWEGRSAKPLAKAPAGMEASGDSQEANGAGHVFGGNRRCRRVVGLRRLGRCWRCGRIRRCGWSWGLGGHVGAAGRLGSHQHRERCRGVQSANGIPSGCAVPDADQAAAITAIPGWHREESQCLVTRSVPRSSRIHTHGATAPGDGARGGRCEGRDGGGAGGTAGVWGVGHRPDIGHGGAAAEGSQEQEEALHDSMPYLASMAASWARIRAIFSSRSAWR